VVMSVYPVVLSLSLALHYYRLAYSWLVIVILSYIRIVLAGELDSCVGGSTPSPSLVAPAPHHRPHHRPHSSTKSEAPVATSIKKEEISDGFTHVKQEECTVKQSGEGKKRAKKMRAAVKLESESETAFTQVIIRPASPISLSAYLYNQRG
jgi:hypothetical protein